MSISKVTIKSGNKITIKYPGPQGPAGAGGGPGGGSGDVVGPASSVSGNLPTFSGTTGKVIQDGGVSVAAVRDRATHTGVQAIATVTGLQTALDGKEAVGVAATALAAHVAAADPHTIYTTVSEAAAAAPVQSVAGKTGIVTLAKADVGLGSVDNTSDASKPVSTAQQTALNLKADLASPTLTGTPGAPTAAADTNTTQIATTAFVQQEISNDTTRALASHQHNAADIAAGIVAIARGGTGLGTTPTNGQLPIGNGTGFTLANITAGANVTVTNSAGGIQIAATGGGGSSPLTTDGDIYTRASGADARLPISANLGAILASDGTAPAYIHPRSHYLFQDDFDGTTINPYSTGWTGGGTGGTKAAINGETNAPGIIQLATGAVATNSSFLHRGNVALLAGGGRIVCEWRFRVPTLSNGTDTFTIRIGLHDSTSGAPVDGLHFEYTDAVNSGLLQVKASSNSTASTTNSSAAISANTWYKGLIDINAAGTNADFYIDGSLIGSVASNIPTGTGRVFGPNAGITKSVGTTSRTLDLDYFWIWQKLTTAR